MTGIAMTETRLTRSGRTLAVLAATSSTLLGLPVGTPSAAAAPCPDVEVVFARGTSERQRQPAHVLYASDGMDSQAVDFVLRHLDANWL
ncbi:hypothetical protein A5784_22860 [Mycobacterium sp. 852013-50091_SCH5140682]|nr:hypothetical protein [Mycobacterium sp. 852013-50091_SCH5140682]OBB99310.1 hypothetical protein A5784_22860 [Mycobacterium sp. 852013-50091_SCH5140682]